MKSASAFRRGPQLLTATEWVCASCRRQGTQQRHITGASAATAASKRSRAREPLPIVPPPSPSRHSKAEPLKPLLKPIGQPDPPKAGDNPHYDPRSFSEKWEDYFDNHEAYYFVLFCHACVLNVHGQAKTMAKTRFPTVETTVPSQGQDLPRKSAAVPRRRCSLLSKLPRLYACGLQCDFRHYKSFERQNFYRQDG